MKAFIGLLACVALSACGNRKDPNITFMPDMAYSPAIKAQEENNRMPVEGTVPREAKPYPYAGRPDLAASLLKNPLKRTRPVLKHGQELFNIYCIVCHGPMGEGDGSVVPKFPRPPSLQSSKIRNWSDGSVFHTITEGQNLMPSYASQVSPEDRWAIIHYLRVLQRAKNPSAADLKKAESW